MKHAIFDGPADELFDDTPWWIVPGDFTCSDSAASSGIVTTQPLSGTDNVAFIKEKKYVIPSNTGLGFSTEQDVLPPNSNLDFGTKNNVLPSSPGPYIPTENDIRSSQSAAKSMSIPSM